MPLCTLEQVETPPYDPLSSGDGWNTDINGSGNVNGDHARAQQDKAFTINCEMVLTDKGKELVRVCVVDYWTQEVVWLEVM